MTVFSKKACVPCAKLKLWLNNKKLVYEEVPIENHIDELSKLGFVSAPVVKIGDRYFNGANISSIAQHLGI
jgi:glutaredoxin